MKKTEKGITLVSLVIIVILLLIISGITFFELNRNTENTGSNIAESELKMVQNVILQIKTESDLTRTNYSELPGSDISKEEVQNIAKGIPLKGEEWEYKLLDKQALQGIGITNTEDTYIVNYNTGEVINKDRFNEFEKPLYIYSVNK